MLTRLKAVGNRAYHSLIEARQEQADRLIERLQLENRDPRDRL